MPAHPELFLGCNFWLVRDWDNAEIIRGVVDFLGFILMKIPNWKQMKSFIDP